MVAKTSSPSEVEIQNAVRLAVGKTDSVLWRNNVGQALVFDELRKPPHCCPACGHKFSVRRIEYGLFDGSSDLIGLTGSGQFIAFEIKTHKGRVSPEQEMYIELVRSKGGLGEVIRSPEEALAALKK